MLDKDGLNLLFNQVMTLWVKPEIEKKRRFGEINGTYDLRAAQVLFSVERGTKVRFNDDVKATLLLKIKGPRNIVAGDKIYETDVDKIQSIELTEKDPNTAHITLVRIRDDWTISYDFKYNKKLRLEHLDASQEFFETAINSLSGKRLRPFYENMFASVELAVKSILLALPDKTVLKEKSHEKRKEKFEKWANLGNVKVEYVKLLDLLISLRSSARYLSSTLYLKHNPKQIEKLTKEILEYAKSLV